jgi:uncharacterized protein YfiM (DUF2279 family)
VNRSWKKIFLFIWLVIPAALSSMPDSLQTKHNHDPWLAYDKVLHFGISCSLVLSTQYVLENTLNVDRETALPAGVTVSAANGVVKEYWDKKTGSFFSRRDLIADAAGILVGVLIIVMDN